MNPSDLQQNTLYQYKGIDEIKVTYIGKTPKGNYAFVAAEGRYAGVKRPLNEKAVINLIEKLS